MSTIYFLINIHLLCSLDLQLRPIYTECQRQRQCSINVVMMLDDFNSSGKSLQNGVATHFLTNSLVFNQSNIANIITALMRQRWLRCAYCKRALTVQLYTWQFSSAPLTPRTKTKILINASFIVCTNKINKMQCNSAIQTECQNKRYLYILSYKNTVTKGVQ